MSRLHVFEDLKPYICTFPLCKDEFLTFSTRKLWADHEFAEHRNTIYWKCAECSAELPTSSDLTDHLRVSHDICFSERNLVSVLATSKGIRGMNPKLGKCPLCLETPGSTRESFISHICRHMESIALSALLGDVDSGSDADEEFDKLSESSSNSKPPGNYFSEDMYDDVTNCFCGNRDDDGATVLCKICNSWQHRKTQQGQAYVLSPDQIRGMDHQSFPRTILGASTTFSGMPQEVRTWGQLKAWATQSPEITKEVVENLGGLQVMHFQSKIAAQQNIGARQNAMNGQGAPPALLALSQPTNTEHHHNRIRLLSPKPSSGFRLTDSTFGNGDESKESGRCPTPGCGKLFKDLRAHMLTHQAQRPEKCPIVTCEYHIKGFARKYDKQRHTLTHYKGTMVCGFCPGSGSPAEKSFNRADVFKRHLTSVHKVEQSPSNSRKKTASDTANGKCSICLSIFKTAQDFYEHLDDCVLSVVQREEPSEAINIKALTDISRDPAVRETLERNNLPIPKH